MQNNILGRNFLACFHIVIYLIVETAFEFCTHTSQFLRVERNVLEAGCVCTYTHKVFHPSGTTEFASARSCTTDASCFLSCSDLFHFDAHMESICQNLDELSEIDTLVGNIIEDSFVAVSLIFHIANLHLQSKIFCNLSALNHGAVLTALGFLALFDIYRFGNSIDALDVICRFEIGFLDLQFHQSSCKSNHTNVMARTCLHRHDIPFFQVEVVDVVIICLSGVLKLHFHKVCAFGIARHIGKPVVCVQLSVLASYCLAAETSVATIPHSEFHILVIHNNLILIVYIV